MAKKSAKSGKQFYAERKAADSAKATAIDKSLTANMLDARMKDLSVFMRTDKVNSMRYAEANRAYVIAQLVRMGNFMKRHNLTSQLLTEDEQGSADVTKSGLQATLSYMP